MPGNGWPGTLITIKGRRFSESRDENLVTIGGESALVIEAAESSLFVMAGESTAGGTIRVEVNGTPATSAAAFKIRAYPPFDDIHQQAAKQNDET